MKDFLYLDIPLFKVSYKKWKKYGCTKQNERENIKAALTSASGGYCMYCYARISVDNKIYGNLEHAIEKNNSKKLIECIPNIGIACPNCNQSLKRIGEPKRKVEDSVRTAFEEKTRCTVNRRKQCTVPCRQLRILQKEYSKMPDAEIILQPMGIIGEQSGEPLAIRYDILKMEFQPNIGLYTYSEEESAFINRHIQRFRLNDPRYKTTKLVEYIKNVIDSGGAMCEYEYNNMIVQLFADKIRDKTAEEKVDICSKIYCIIFCRIS